jgi:glutathione S-transferase|eukprot:m.419917 g.419917  ORF g.419917 m.419917 type:complete len:220 (+) comp31941_c0_seq1:89-748(+)
MARCLRIVYFGVRAKAEPIRLCLAYAKIPYEDVTPADYFGVGWRAGAKEAAPFGQLPLLLVDNRPPLAQSGAIIRYVAALAGLVPADPFEAAQCDAVYEAAQELMTVNPVVNVFVGDAFVEKRQLYLEQAPSKIANIARALGDTGPFFFGVAPLYADFTVYHALSNTLLLEPTVLDAHSNLKRFITAIEALPGVTEYLAERPDVVDIGVAPRLRAKAKI